MMNWFKSIIVRDIDALIKDFVKTRDALQKYAQEEKKKAADLTAAATQKIENAVRAENIAGKLHDIVR